jgi:PAS domain S-box-containing protein
MDHRSGTSAASHDEHAVELLELGDAFLELDRDWRIVRVNHRQEQLSRKASSETVGRSFWEVWPELATPSSAYWREYHRCMSERVPVRFEEHHAPLDLRFEEHHAPLDLWTGVTAYPVSDGGIAIFFRDIGAQKRAEEALRDSEARFRSVLENMSEGVMLFDGGGNLTYQNPASLRIHGFERGADGRIRRDDLPQTWNAWDESGRPIGFDEWPVSRVFRGERFQDQVLRVERAETGYVFHGSYNGAPIRFGPGGRVEVGFITIREITPEVRADAERARAVEAVRASEAKFRSVFEQAAIGMARVSFEDARWIDVNDAFCRMLGRSREELLRTPWPEITHPADVDLDLVPFRRMAAGALDSYTVEKRFIHADGHAIWARLTLSLVRDASGKPDYEVAIIEDIGDRKRAEEAAQKSERLLRSTLDHFPTVIAFKDREGRFLDLNAEVERALGLPKERIIGRTIADFVPADAAAALTRRDEEVMESRRAVQVEEVTPLPSGTLYHLNTNFPLVDADGRVYGTGHISHDITDVKRADASLRDANERLREEGRRKNEFLGMLSHELRNPLAPIRNALYILDHAQPEGQQARRAKDILARQVTHLTRLVDDLLDMTRIARGMIQLRHEELDLAALVRRTAEDYRLVMQDRGLELALELPRDSVAVNGDPARLTQIFGNLLNNAAKFTPAGGQVTLSMATERDRVVAHVRDTGPGIDPELLPSLFQPFTQGKQTLARSEGGLGLGLSLVKALVSLHGGDVTVAGGGAGRGAHFIVTLPLAGPRDREQPATTRDVGEERSVGQRRVLVVEDNRDAADSLAELIDMLGHQALVAYDAPSGLAKASADLPDVVLCDIGLPGMDGYEFARRLRALAAGEAVRLVALSGYAQPEDLTKAIAAGFDSHIAKPPTPEQIAAVLHPRPGARDGVL